MQNNTTSQDYERRSDEVMQKFAQKFGFQLLRTDGKFNPTDFILVGKRSSNIEIKCRSAKYRDYPTWRIESRKLDYNDFVFYWFEDDPDTLYYISTLDIAIHGEEKMAYNAKTTATDTKTAGIQVLKKVYDIPTERWTKITLK